MKSRLAFSALGAGLIQLWAATAEAAPTLRAQVNQKGDFVLLGNTLGFECASGAPAPVVGTIPLLGCGLINVDDSSPDIFWRADSPMAGQAYADGNVTAAQARSTAVLQVPAGATITHAFLYWGATLPVAGFDTTATIERPGAGGFTQNVTAIQSFQATNKAYQSVADVTAIVQAAGPGAFRVSGVEAASLAGVDSDALFAGWWMAVFYTRATDPVRNLALFDGLDTVTNMVDQNATLSGFLVPNAGFDGKLGVVTFEGDNALSGDQLFFNGGTALSNAQNPINNFFNGTRSYLGAPVSNAGDLPQLTGTAQSMAGLDLDVVDITGKLAAGQSTATIQATSSGDLYYLAGFVTSISTFQPNFSTSTKSATDVNGGSLLPGDVLQYSIVVTNTGNDTSVNTVLNDTLPAGVTFVPGSIQITAGSNAGIKTDGVGDDQGEYVAATKTVTLRLGTGANGTTGGKMAVGATTTVTFKVTVNAGTSGTISNQATITAAGELGAPPSTTPTDGNGTTAGTPPTDVIVDECAVDANCPATKPICLTSADPNVCVQCLLDAQCTGATPTCNTTTHACTCVPSAGGVEICDGKDNDCDGTVDEGNPGGGLVCVTGLPGVCAVGATSCTGGALGCMAAVQPGQKPEACNGLDDNCNGVVDDGLNLGMACTNGVGECAGAGINVCNAMGGVICTGVQGEPAPELCGDQLDSDCDGKNDNGCVDTDGDGLVDAIEIKIGTDPNDADSDDDGVPDGQEPSYAEDSDGDGLINALDPDSDNDGLFDGTEMGKGCNAPGIDLSKHTCIPDADLGATVTDPLDADTDDGGVNDGSEDVNLNGKIDPGETDPTAGHGADDKQNQDTDGDGLSNGVEITIGTDPNDADSDDDGVPDGQEPNPSVDSDGDGVINALDPDSDNDGLFDGTEMGKGCNAPGTDASKGHCKPDADLGLTKTSPLDADTDDGGVSDGSEDTNLDGKIDLGETNPTAGHGADDKLNQDTDGDGLSNGVEATLGTDPNDADSDDDGVSDGQEANPGDDTDGDGKINALDPDSDNDGLFDGTETGKGCTGPGVDITKGHCIADGDLGATTTSPIDADTDDGSVKDGVEDANHNGVIDPGERDPNNATDDVLGMACTQDSDCGDPTSGQVCDDATDTCVTGCRGVGGNGCADGETCTSSTTTIGVCIGGAGGGSATSSGTASTGSAGTGNGGNGGGGLSGFTPSGNGIICSARPGAGGEGAEWLVGGALVALAAARRRRRDA